MREFLGLFVPIVLAFVILYLIVDFFDRLDILLKNHATMSATLRYFLFKIPLIVTQILPPAVLAAMLISLGMLSRRNEITRIAGIGRQPGPDGYAAARAGRGALLAALAVERNDRPLLHARVSVRQQHRDPQTAPARRF